MAKIIAVAGKGGTGKTTFCGLLIQYLAKAGKTPILAIDADPNSNLNEVLGVELETTIGDVREEIATAENMSKSPIPPGMSKQEYADFKMAGALAEGTDYDLLAMGKPQGKGCYCFVNDILKNQIDKFSKSYEYMVVDNEAGMEHISRGVLPAADTIILVSDCSARGIQAVGRIAEMIRDLKMKVNSVQLVVNRAPNGVLNEGTKAEIEKYNLTLAGVLPQDDSVYEYDSNGRPLVDLPSDSPVKKAFKEIVDKLDL